MAQQMVWWGHDVRYPSGNLLIQFGMTRSPSPGLTATSCYRMSWENGLIELHGAVASWTPDKDRSGIVFTRDRGLMEIWNGSQPPIPGSEFGRHAPPAERWQAAQSLIRWIASYEQWIHQSLGPEWRMGCWRAIRRLPKGKPWLPPSTAREWWTLASTKTPPRSKQLFAA